MLTNAKRLFAFVVFVLWPVSLPGHAPFDLLALASRSVTGAPGRVTSACPTCQLEGPRSVPEPNQFFNQLYNLKQGKKPQLQSTRPLQQQCRA